MQTRGCGVSLYSLYSLFSCGLVVLVVCSTVLALVYSPVRLKVLRESSFVFTYSLLPSFFKSVIPFTPSLITRLHHSSITTWVGC